MDRTFKRTPTPLCFWDALIYFAICLTTCVDASARVTSRTPREVQVCRLGCEFQSIRAAVAAVPPGSTVTVGPGVYREGGIVLNQAITLRGTDWPVLDGESEVQPIVIVKAGPVTVSGFVIRDTGKSYIAEIAGIRVIESSNCTIENNRFLNTTYGVYLEKSQNCHILGNEFRGEAHDEVSSGNGIHVWTGSGHQIERNQIHGHRDGIYLEFAKGCEVRSNEVTHNVRYGLHFMSSSNAFYGENRFSENGSGVAVMYSKNIRMIRNHFLKNTGTAAYGLLLKDISDSEVRENEFANNTVGIFMEGSNRTHFDGNRFKSNGWGLRIMSDCESDIFTGNSFLENTFEVSTNADRSENIFKKNYWSHYDGYDMDRDGTGDVPHRPVSLSSIILERVDSSYVLMHSLLFQLLDTVEQVLPQMIPEPLKDEEPLMLPPEGNTA